MAVFPSSWLRRNAKTRVAFARRHRTPPFWCAAFKSPRDFASARRARAREKHARAWRVSRWEKLPTGRATHATINRGCCLRANGFEMILTADTTPCSHTHPCVPACPEARSLARALPLSVLACLPRFLSRFTSDRRCWLLVQRCNGQSNGKKRYAAQCIRRTCTPSCNQ